MKKAKTFDPKRLPNIKPTYTVSLKYGDKEFTASSDDITEAILGLRPDRINNRTVFTLNHDGRVATLMKTAIKAKRILSHRLTAVMTGRSLLMLLK